MQNYAVVDIETDPFLHGRIPEPFLIGLYDGENYYEFLSVPEFFDFIKNFKMTIYAHNGGKFDFHYFKEYFEVDKPIKIINGRIAEFTYNNITFRDSFLILPIALKNYEKTEIDYNKFEKQVRHKHIDEISEYLKDDCIYTYELIDTFIKTYGHKLTLAGSAFKFYKDLYNIKEVKSTRNFFEEISPYYKGGRVECFKKGIISHDFKMFDINSAYPFAMQYNHPCGTHIAILENLPEKNIEQSFIKIACISKGAFPFIDDKKRTTYPNDNEKRLYHITGWEYLKAMELNLLSNCEILECLVIPQQVNFKNYVNHFYKLKNKAQNENDKKQYIMAKLFLNSLYGKFGANPDNYRNYYICKNDDILTKQFENEYVFDNYIDEYKCLMSKPLEENEKIFINVSTSASITGFVRSMLLEAINKADGMMYCDTDCIVAKNIKVPVSEKLGDWKLEGEFYKGAIAGKKMYYFTGMGNPDKKASKGVNLNEKELVKIAQGEEVIHKSDNPTFSLKKDTFFQERTIKMT